MDDGVRRLMQDVAATYGQLAPGDAGKRPGERGGVPRRSLRFLFRGQRSRRGRNDLRHIAPIRECRTFRPGEPSPGAETESGRAASKNSLPEAPAAGGDNCCVQPSCDWCALHEGACDCFTNLQAGRLPWMRFGMAQRPGCRGGNRRRRHGVEHHPRAPDRRA